MGIKKIVGTWRCFGKDPVLATRIMIDVASAKLLGTFNPVYKKYEQDLEVTKRRCHEEAVQNLAIGTVALMSLVFGTLYLFIYLTYRVLWI